MKTNLLFRLHSFVTLLVAGLLALSLSACDSGGSNEDDDVDVSPESFSISIEGEGIDRTLNGTAFFASGTEPESGESAFIVYFSDAEDAEEATLFGIIGRATTRPGTGSYDFANFSDDDFDPDGDALKNQFIFFMWEFSESTWSTYTSTTGQLNLTTSSDNRVAGAIDVDGEAFTLDFNNQEEDPEPVTVTISGEFDAPGDDFVDWTNVSPGF